MRLLKNRFHDVLAFRAWVGVVLVLLAAFLLYLSLWPGPPFPTNDTPAYLAVARDLQDFRLDSFQVRPPGYGWLLMLTGSLEAPTRLLLVVQLVMYLGMVGFLVWLLDQAKVNRFLIGGLLVLTLLPYQVMTAARALTEAFSQFLLTFGIGLLALWLARGGWQKLLLASALLAFLGITRPVFQVLSLVLAITSIIGSILIPSWRKRLLWTAASLTFFALLIVGQVAWHNFYHYGYFSITPLTGLNLTQKTARVLERLPEEYAPIRKVLIHYRDQSLLSEPHQVYNYIWKVPMEELQPIEGMSFAEMSSYYTRLNLLLIAKAPLIYLQEVGYSLVNYFGPVNNHISDFGLTTLKIAWSALHYLTLLVLLISFLILGGAFLFWLGLPKEHKRALASRLDTADQLRWSLLLLALLAFAYNTGITVLVEMGYPWTRLSVEGMLLILCVLGVDYWLRLRPVLRRWVQKEITFPEKPES